MCTHAFSQVHNHVQFELPVTIPVLLSANYGELRPNHFHAGIDIKTQKITGKSIIAIDSGYVSRIVVGPYGYGKALYVSHPSGQISVYGHLKSFAPAIDSFVTRYQYEQKTHSVNINIPEGTLRVFRGEEIAKSGNSGSSGGPHLHFEIRDSVNNAINPLFFYPQITDRAAPQIQSLYVYSLDSVHGIQTHSKKYRVYQKTPGEYYIPGPIPVSNKIGFGIKGNDKIHNVYHIFGFYTVSLSVDSKKIYSRTVDTISFYETRDINSLLDYELFSKSRQYIEKLYVEPNNELSIYTQKNNGIHVKPHKMLNCEVIVQDFHANTSRLHFKIIADTNSAHMPITAPVYSYATPFEYSNEQFSFITDSAAFYKDFTFKVEIDSSSIETEFSPRYTINSSELSLKKTADISIQSHIRDSLRPYATVRYESPSGRRRSLQAAFSPDGTAHLSTNRIGTYSVVVDTSAPIVNRLNFTSGTNIQHKNHISFRMYDNFSGIAEYIALIDGKWCMLDFDGKYSYVVLDLTKAPITKNSEHTLTIYVKDIVGNTNEKEYSFYW